MNEVRRAKNVILFIDELHTLVGAGGAEGAIDASQRAQARAVAAARSSASARRRSTSTASTSRRTRPWPGGSSRSRSIRRARKTRSRSSRVCAIATKRTTACRSLDAALEAAVEMSDRYITGRCLPDKAIDVLDEAGARIRLRSMTKPPNLAELEEQIERLSIQKDEAVKNAEYEEAAASARPGRSAAREEGRDAAAVAREGQGSRRRRGRRSHRRGRQQDDRRAAHAPREGRGRSGCWSWKTSCTSASSSQDEAIKAISQDDPPGRCGSEGSEPPDGQLPVPRPDRRRQDAALQGAGRVHVRRRGRARCRST